MIQILLVEVDSFAAAGLRKFLKRVPDFEIIGSASKGQGVLTQLASQPPDVIVLGCPLPDMPETQLAAEILARGWHTRILFMGAPEALERIYARSQKVRNGYFVRGEPQESIERAIRALARGEPWFSQKIAAILLARLNAKEEEEEEEKKGELTPRQVEILLMVEQGLTNRAIALALKLKKRTVDSHMERILQKLEAKNRAEACAVAREKGWMRY